MSLRSLIFDHFLLKLFSLVLATLIWLAVDSNLRNDPVPKRFGASPNTELHTFVNRPIMIMADPSEQLRITLVPEHATVTVQGPRDLVQGLKDEDVSVFVRLTERRPVSGDLPIHVHVPTGALVAELTPLTATIKPIAHDKSANP